MKKLLVAFAFTLSLAACGDSSSSSSSTSYGKPIGGACSSDGDCAGSSLCATNYPGGYCFMTCTGNPSVCPSGSFCSRVSRESAECYRTCFSSTDCRSGYVCESVSGSSTKICLPK